MKFTHYMKTYLKFIFVSILILTSCGASKSDLNDPSISSYVFGNKLVWSDEI